MQKHKKSCRKINSQRHTNKHYINSQINVPEQQREKKEEEENGK